MDFHMKRSVARVPICFEVSAFCMKDNEKCAYVAVIRAMSMETTRYFLRLKVVPRL